jgi:YD repeat-containing protein
MLIKAKWWRRCLVFWDNLFQACDRGLAKLIQPLCGRNSSPQKRRSVWLSFDVLEARWVPTTTINAVEGVQLTNVVLPTPSGGTNGDPYTATIKWGDNNDTFVPGNVTGTYPQLTVTGTYTYGTHGEQTSYSGEVKLTDTNTQASITTNFTAVVADAPLLAGTVTAPAMTANQVVTGATVFSFADLDSTETDNTNFSATINWGDGNSSSGSVVHDSGSNFHVTGSHTYGARWLRQTFSVQVTDLDGGAILLGAGAGVDTNNWGSTSRLDPCGCNGAVATLDLGNRQATSDVRITNAIYRPGITPVDIQRLPYDPSSPVRIERYSFESVDPELQYSAATVNPQPIIPVQFQSDPGQPVPTSISVTLNFNGQNPVTSTFTATGHSQGDNYLLPIQVGTALTATGRYSYSVSVTATEPAGGTNYTVTSSGDYQNVEVNNGSVGTGWSLNPAVGSMSSITGSGVLFSYGLGQGAFYSVNSDGSYSTPFAHATLTTTSNPTSYTLSDSGHQYLYNASGQITSIVDPGGIVRETFTYDGSNRLSTQTDALGGVYTYAYSSGGMLTTVTVPGSNTFTFKYSGNNLTEVDQPDGTSRLFSYDAHNHLLSDSIGTSGVSFSYNATTGLTSAESIAGGTITTTFAPFIAAGLGSNAINASAAAEVVTDPLSHATTSAYDANHRLLSRTYADSTSETWTYDGFGDVLTHVDRLNHTTTYAYAPGSQDPTLITFPDSSTVQFAYDPNFNEPTVVIDQLGQTTSFTYDPSTGNVLTSTNPLGKVTTYTYNSAGMISTLTDPMSRVTTYKYSSDNLHLTAVVDPAGATTAYAYDSANNLTNVVDPLGRTTATSYDSMHRVSVVTEPSGFKTTYTYTSQGWLLTVTGPTGRVTSYGYDTQGWQTAVIDAANDHTVASTVTSVYDNAGRVTASIDAMCPSGKPA